MKKIYSDKGQLVRVRSVENVINELISLKQEYAAKDCNFVDDLFGMEKSWFKRFAVEYKNRIALPFMCLTHLKYLSEEYIQNLKVAGCKLVCLGIECGNEEYRRNILKRNYKNSYIIEVAKRLREYEIPFFSFNIILLPGETLKMSLETLKLNMKCKPFSAEAFIYQPFPRTDLADYAISNSYYKDDNMAIPNNFFTDSVLDNPDKKKLLRLFYLFSFTTRFRFFYPLVRILICLPFDKLYKTIHYHYKNEARKYYLHELGASEPKVKFRNILMSLIKVDKEPDFLYHRCKKVNA